MIAFVGGSTALSFNEAQMWDAARNANWLVTRTDTAVRLFFVSRPTMLSSHVTPLPTLQRSFYTWLFLYHSASDTTTLVYLAV
jgi:hypothetical protein